MNRAGIGHRMIQLEEVDSTNEELKRMAEEGAGQGTVLVAKYQKKGRGRMGRRWDSPPGDNIYMSILLRPDMELTKVSMTTLVAALAVAKAIDEVASEDKVVCQIKWPNDLVRKGRKVCGILTEMKASMDGIQYVIVGIGINVNREVFPEEIAHMASAIQLPFSQKQGPGKQHFTSEKHGKDLLIERLLYHFEEKYNLFLQQGDLKPFLEEYNGRLAGLGQQVQIISREGNRIGISDGIDEGGALLVRDQEGNIEKIISGEVSVRGLYGYVD